MNELDKLWALISDDRIAALADGLTALGLYPAEEGNRCPDAVSVALAIAEAARNFAAVTAGMENTIEGAALLAALKQVEGE